VACTENEINLIKNFIKYYKNNNEIELIHKYKYICKNLLFHDEELVVKVIDIIKNNIESWAKKQSKIYKEMSDLEYLSKEHLLDEHKWKVKMLESESGSMSTSGTTGPKFKYSRWNKFLKFIEVENHYRPILEEYKINENPNVLYFFNNYRNYDNSIVLETKSNNFMEKHGAKEAKTFSVNFRMKYNVEYFYKKLLDWIDNNKIDVILASGSDINALCYYIQKYNYKNQICNLLSNTCEKFLKKDVQFLLEQGYVKNFCDHMRCWDGGATFFTCKEGNYHVLDNLSYCFAKNNKLISTDYFSFTNPFVNYWNGDYCEIDNRYERCDCGRLFRKFKFIDSRPFAVKGESINKIKETILNLGIIGIKRVICSVDNIVVILKCPIEEESKNKLIKIFDKINFNFIVEK
jgi:phenylacetate-coenzyme A ligase PaaK-like adenylate-forming protein